LPKLASASKFKISDAELYKFILQSKEVSSEEFCNILEKNINAFAFVKAKDSGNKTQGGFLIRSFFCGCIALHRYYMGTTNNCMWALYCCIPVVGPLNNLVDFWASVFISDFYKKYENNDKYIVWLDEL
jgi:hypothetical protein